MVPPARVFFQNLLLAHEEGDLCPLRLDQSLEGGRASESAPSKHPTAPLRQARRGVPGSHVWVMRGPHPRWAHSPQKCRGDIRWSSLKLGTVSRTAWGSIPGPAAEDLSSQLRPPCPGHGHSVGRWLSAAFDLEPEERQSRPRTTHRGRASTPLGGRILISPERGRVLISPGISSSVMFCDTLPGRGGHPPPQPHCPAGLCYSR